MAYKWMGHPIAAPLKIESDRDIWTVEKLNKSIDRGASNAQRWKVSFSVIVNQNEDDLFLTMSTQMETKLTMLMPQLNAVRKKAVNGWPGLNQASVVGTAAAGSTSATVNNSGTTKFIPKGSFINASSHSKVYMTTTDVTLTQGVDTVINFFPALKASVAGSFKFDDNVNFTYYIDDTMVQGITYNDGILTGIDNIQLIEAI